MKCRRVPGLLVASFKTLSDLAIPFTRLDETTPEQISEKLSSKGRIALSLQELACKEECRELLRMMDSVDDA